MAAWNSFSYVCARARHSYKNVNIYIVYNETVLVDALYFSRLQMGSIPKRVAFY